jgi:hypothetical protein
MNAFNVDLDRSIESWAAFVHPTTPELEGGIRLGSSDSELFVDTIHTSITRDEHDPNLGVKLIEISGGRTDGVGITIVESIIPGGNAMESGILPGDSIVKLEIKDNKPLMEPTSVMEEMHEVGLECLDYDASVGAIYSLPTPPAAGETLAITVKRLRRKPRVAVTIQHPPSHNVPDETYQLYACDNLRRAMLIRGVNLNDEHARRFDTGGTGNCGGEEICGTCVVNVVKGKELLNSMDEREAQMDRGHPDWRLSCQTIVGDGMKEGEMTIQIDPGQW